MRGLCLKVRALSAGRHTAAVNPATLGDTAAYPAAAASARAAFVECEGVELMHLLLKGKKSSRYGAIKAIDFATTR